MTTPDAKRSEHGYCPECEATLDAAIFEFGPRTWYYTGPDNRQYYTCADCGAFFFVEG